MPATLLCVGDLHLGRRPGGLPEALAGLRHADLRPEAVWSAAVDRALDVGGARASGESPGPVDAVLLAGDVVESLEDRFAAFGALKSGVRRLVEAGIAVFAVAGNHDGIALPRLADRIDGFRLLGRGGRWEETEVANRAGIPIRLWGWSFPHPHVHASPLDAFPFHPPQDAVALGLLHGDLDQTASLYAPVRRADLEAAGADAWFLGHVHKPDPLASMPRPLGYLGSMSPLDAGEPGPHGPWLARIDGPGAVRMEHLPIAPLRFERLGVDLAELDGGSGEAGEDDLADRLFDLIRAGLRVRHDAIAGEIDAVRVLGCRVRLEGRCREHRGIAGIIRERSLAGRDIEIEGKRWFVEKIEDAGAPAVDLEGLARGGDPPGILARRLLALRRGDPEAAGLLREAREQLQAEARKAHWGEVAGESEGARDEDDLRGMLLCAGQRALEELLAQRERGGGAPP